MTARTLFRILVILMVLPLGGYPALLSAMSAADDTLRTLLWLYPAYVVCAAVCAWICYPARKDVAWILIILLALSHAGMYFLCF